MVMLQEHETKFNILYIMQQNFDKRFNGNEYRSGIGQVA
jgi:hypothetical protein